MSPSINIIDLPNISSLNTAANAKLRASLQTLAADSHLDLRRVEHLGARACGTIAEVASSLPTSPRLSIVNTPKNAFRMIRRLQWAPRLVDVVMSQPRLVLPSGPDHSGHLLYDLVDQNGHGTIDVLLSVAHTRVISFLRSTREADARLRLAPQNVGYRHPDAIAAYIAKAGGPLVEADTISRHIRNTRKLLSNTFALLHLDAPELFEFDRVQGVRLAVPLRVIEPYADVQFA